MNNSAWAETLGQDWVEGVLATFEYATNKWQSIEDSARNLDNEFGQFASGVQNGNFAGNAADAFSELLTETRQAIGDLPSVAADFRTILSNHTEQLAALHTSARIAVARARANWSALHVAEANSDLATQRQKMLRSQIQQVQLSGDPVQQIEVTNLLDAEATAAGEAQSHLVSVSRAQAAVAADQASYNTIRDDETTLNDQTANALGAVDLRSLRDPSWIEKVGHSVGKFFTDFAQNVQDLIGAVARGDWTRALWELRDVVNSLLLVVGLVALVLAFVASGGTLAFLFAAAAFAGAAVMLAIDTTLFVGDSTHPETGQKIGIKDLVFDVIGVVAAGVGLSKAGAALSKSGGRFVAGDGVKLAGGMGTTAKSKNIVRVAFDQASGIDVFKAGRATKTLGWTNNLHFTGGTLTAVNAIDALHSFDSRAGFLIDPANPSSAVDRWSDKIGTSTPTPLPTSFRQQHLLEEIRKTKRPSVPYFFAPPPQRPTPNVSDRTPVHA
jgi:hypothetical protein